MKYFVSIIWFLPLLAKAQPALDSLRNRVWVSGYEYNSDTADNYVIFDFRGDTLAFKYMTVPALFLSYTNGSICEQNGNLLMFSNGCGVMDSTFKYVQGAHTIYTGDYQEYLCNDVGGGRMSQSMLMLPFSQDSSYRLFYGRKNQIPDIVCDRLQTNKIKIRVDGQLYKANGTSVAINDIIYGGNLTACRHANGLDWWVVQPDIENNGYYIMHVSYDGLLSHKQSIGVSSDHFENGTGMAVFSPDGSKYARYTIHSDLQVFDFDRCAGIFSNPIHVPIVDAADTIYAAGVAFSPSGRYLYVSSSLYIYQFDMLAADFAASKTTVAVYDGFMAYNHPLLPTLFYMAELGPDNKIYMSSTGGRNTCHVIEYPDSAGIACHVVQHKYLLEFPISRGLPHFPNFKLGPTATPCIPVGTEEQSIGMEVRIYPNPATATLMVEVPQTVRGLRYALVDAVGREVLHGRITGGKGILQVGGVPPGLYFLRVSDGEGGSVTKKVVILRE